MATIRAYVNQLWDAQQFIARQLGSDLARGPLEQRAAVLSIDLTTAVILKTLVDAGVTTDVALQATMTSVRNAIYKKQPGFVPAPGDNDEGVTQQPDLG
jgi:hypothetical protein